MKVRFEIQGWRTTLELEEHVSGRVRVLDDNGCAAKEGVSSSVEALSSDEPFESGRSKQ